jgi:hypothetical protein
MGDCFGQIPNLYAFSRTTYLSGNTNYFNNTNGVSANDPATIWDGDYRIGKGFLVSPNLMLTPYLGAGYDWWKRTISAVPTGAFIETYSHGYAGAGLLLQITPAPRWVLSAYGFGGGTFSSQMNFNPTTAANVAISGPNHTFGLGNSGTAKAGTSVDFAVTERLHANAGVDYTYFRYGESAQEELPAFGTFEPPSRTSNWTVTAGLGYSFYSGGPCCALVTK